MLTTYVTQTSLSCPVRLYACHVSCWGFTLHSFEIHVQLHPTSTGLVLQSNLPDVTSRDFTLILPELILYASYNWGLLAEKRGVEVRKITLSMLIN